MKQRASIARSMTVDTIDKNIILKDFVILIIGLVRLLTIEINIQLVNSFIIGGLAI